MNIETISLIIKLNIIIESSLLMSYLIAYYLVMTSTIKNGLNNALSFNFLSGALYAVTFLIFLMNVHTYDVYDSVLSYGLIAFGISRLTVLASRLYLMHELREFVIKKRAIK